MAGSASARSISSERSSIWRSLSNIAGQRLPGRHARPRRAAARGREVGPLPLGRRGRLALVLALETLDAAGGVHELLLARIERVALGAHFDANVGLGGPGLDDLAARASDRRIHVLRMNASLHGPPPRTDKNTSDAPKTQNPRAFPGVSVHDRGCRLLRVRRLTSYDASG